MPPPYQLHVSPPPPVFAGLGRHDLRLDTDRDGIACESNLAPCAAEAVNDPVLNHPQNLRRIEQFRRNQKASEALSR